MRHTAWCAGRSVPQSRRGDAVALHCANASNDGDSRDTALIFVTDIMSLLISFRKVDVLRTLPSQPLTCLHHSSGGGWCGWKPSSSSIFSVRALLELILLSNLGNQSSVERFEATVSRAAAPSPHSCKARGGVALESQSLGPKSRVQNPMAKVQSNAAVYIWQNPKSQKSFSQGTCGPPRCDYSSDDHFAILSIRCPFNYSACVFRM